MNNTPLERRARELLATAFDERGLSKVASAVRAGTDVYDIEISAISRALSDWRPIESAPKDGTEFLAYTQDTRGNGLSSFISLCAWHPNAGFCTDELREPTHWQPLPEPPDSIASGAHLKDMG